MNGHLVEKIKRIISSQHKIKSMLMLHQVAIEYSPNESTDSFIVIQRLECLIKGIDALLLLVSEEERMILNLHLVYGMKWESVIEEYEKHWTYDRGTDKRTYLYRQQTALKKIALYVNQYSKKIDFSWMDDPFFQNPD